MIAYGVGTVVAQFLAVLVALFVVLGMVLAI